MLGRLARSGSDPRNVVSPPFSPEASTFVPDSQLKMPFKRKASSHSKPSKPAQTGPSLEAASVSATDPPVINLQEIASPSSPISISNPGPKYRELMDSSDEELDLLEASLFAAIGQDGNQVQRQAPDLSTRTRIVEESNKRQSAGRMLSAILVSGETASTNASNSSSGTHRMRYLPLCPALGFSDRRETSNTSLLTVLPGHRNFVHRAEQSDATPIATWPLHELPVELFDLITTHLARDDVKCMRLVNREFEQKVSRTLFHTSVVPFNTEIYDMIDEDRKLVNRVPAPRPKGKTKMRACSQGGEEPFGGLEPNGLQWQNAKEDKEGKVYKGHGLRVFQGFGPHIKRFGMSFEISEKQLSRPPVKKELDHIVSYHGSYDWPSMNYARFATLAGLENAADETSRMKSAFSKLEVVQELALSIDSGLGWLNGPDKSLHASLFEQATPVFGSSYTVPDHATQAADGFWRALKQSQHSFDPHSNIKECALEYRGMSSSPGDLEGMRGSLYSDTRLWSSLDRGKLTRGLSTVPFGFGVICTTANQPSSDANLKYLLMPADLNKEQREWLLETQWAQQAFLESYMLAVIDNPITFGSVTSLNIAKLSSRFLPMLARDVFWNALPQLMEVVLQVCPDWRSVEKDDAGFAQTTSKYPSEAARVFHRDVLQARVAPKKSVKKLTVGWVGGGENAEGMFARNSNVLPAPLTKPDHCTANSGMFGIVFEHLEHLTLHNCWITPPTLEGLVKSHSNKALRKITLDSVSLTAHPKFPGNGQGAGAQQFAQAMAAMQAQLANNMQTPAAAAAGQQFGMNQAQQIMAQAQAQAANAQHQAAHAQQIAAMQQHFNQQMQQFHQQVIGNQAALGGAQAVPTNLNNDAQTNTPWTAGHREGSWPQLINAISPGPVFDDYLPAPAPWEEQRPPRPETNLTTLEFKSCGYAKLPNHAGFDQLVLEPSITHRHILSPWFRTRWGALKSAMMTTSDRNVGQIVQHIPWRELNALQLGWGLSEGWPDASKAEEPEFDGFFAGGTGRFSGIVKQGMASVGQPCTPMPIGVS